MIHHHKPSYIISHHHTSSYIIMHHHTSSCIIIHHHTSSYIITHHHTSSYIIIHQVNHHGKTIVVGGKEDTDTELLVERVRSKGGTKGGGVEGGGRQPKTPLRHSCRCQMAVVRTLERGDVLVPQVYLILSHPRCLVGRTWGVMGGR